MNKRSLIIIGLITPFLLLSGCTPSEAERAATSTAVILMSETRKAAIFQTQTAEPTRTPSPTRTPDTRSPFEKCVDSGSGVRYVITGESVTGVSLTWENDSGGTDQGDYKIPFCKPYSGFENGDFLYISAQIIRPTSGAGSIKCYIYDDDSVIAEANASGFAAIATCSGSAK